MKRTYAVPFAFIALALFVSVVHAVAVVVPVVYVATVSIIGLLVNFMISGAVFIAASGIFGGGLFGKKLSAIIDFCISSLGRVLLFGVCVGLALLTLHPLTQLEIIGAGLLAGALSIAILILYSYKRFSIAQKEVKKKIVLSLVLFSLFVCIGGSLTLLFAVEVTPIVGVPDQKSLADIVLPNMNSSAPVQSDVAEKINQGISGESPTAPIVQGTPMDSLVFYPKNNSSCTIAWQGGEKSIIPTKNCIQMNGFFQERVFCPVLISPSEVRNSATTEELYISSSGSCSESFNAIISENVFLVR